MLADVGFDRGEFVGFFEASAEHVRFTETAAGELVDHPHHLLVEDDDAHRLLEERFQPLVDVVWGDFAVAGLRAHTARL